MDDKVEAVLAAYHERMREEGEMMRRGGAGGAEWRDKVLLAVGPDAGRLINILARSWENTDFDYDITSVAKVQFEHLLNAIGRDQSGPD